MSALRMMSNRLLNTTRGWGWSGLTLFFLLFATTPSRAQTADDALRFADRLPAAGARLTGMAGVGIAGVADFSALYANPAGLGYLQRSHIAGSFSVLRATDDMRYEAPALSGGDPSVSTNLQGVSGYGLGSAGLAYKLPTARGSLVLAGGVNQTGTFVRTLDFVGTNSANSITDTYLPIPGNYTVDSDGSLAFAFDTPLLAYNAAAIDFINAVYENGGYPFIQAVAPGTSIEQGGEVIEEGRITEANFGGAVEAARGVMVGVSLNASFGTYRFTRLYQEIDINNENTAGLYEVVLGDGTVLSGFDELDVEERIRSELVGVNLRGGFSAELSENVRAGFVLETPTWYSVDETYGTRITTFFDNGGSLADGNTDANEFDYTVQTPWRIGGGLSAQFGDLRIAGDLEFVDWTQLRLEADDADFSAANRRIRDFDAVVNSRIGAEYRFDALTLRGGLAYQPDPRAVEIELPDGETTDRTRVFYAAGLSYAFDEQFSIDVGWMQERFNDQYRPYASIDVPGEVDEDGNPVAISAPYIDEDVVRNRFLIGLTYAF